MDIFMNRGITEGQEIENFHFLWVFPASPNRSSISLTCLEVSESALMQPVGQIELRMQRIHLLYGWHSLFHIPGPWSPSICSKYAEKLTDLIGHDKGPCQRGRHCLPSHVNVVEQCLALDKICSLNGNAQLAAQGYQGHVSSLCDAGLSFSLFHV